MRKPIKHNYFLKNESVDYALFKGNTANFTADEVMTFLDEGFSLYIDKREHLQHKNMKPSVMEMIDDNGEVIEILKI